MYFRNPTTQIHGGRCTNDVTGRDAHATQGGRKCCIAAAIGGDVDEAKVDLPFAESQWIRRRRAEELDSIVGSRRRIKSTSDGGVAT